MNPIDNDIKSKNFHNLYLIYGDENFLRLNYKKKLKKALVPENDTMNFTKFDKFNIDV
jgi:DNA polymerase-3 subunit delta